VRHAQTQLWSKILLCMTGKTWSLPCYDNTNWDLKLVKAAIRWVNPFQTNFSATPILPSPYLFWAGKRLVDYL
jgi:hypothetical protein